MNVVKVVTCYGDYQSSIEIEDPDVSQWDSNGRMFILAKGDVLYTFPAYNVMYVYHNEVEDETTT